MQLEDTTIAAAPRPTTPDDRVCGVTGLPSIRATRRGAVGGLLAGLAATGCDAGARRGGLPERPPTGPEPSADPDATLVDAVIADITEVAGVVAAARRTGRALGAELSPWRGLHAAHLAALEADADVRAGRVRGSAAELRSLVRRRETALQRRLADGAVAARSGSLASLLATMSAAIAQQLAAPSRDGR